MKFILKFYNFLEPKWLNDLKKFEQFHEIWSYSSGFVQNDWNALVKSGYENPILCEFFAFFTSVNIISGF